MKEEGFYVGIEDPVEVRRNLLESSKEIIHDLQRYEKLKMIKGQKKEAMDKLKKKIAEINVLIAKLKSIVPESKIEKIAPLQERVPQTTKKVTKEQPRRKTEIEKLNDELRRVEEKLKKLG